MTIKRDLLRTKFFAPSLRADLVARPRLLAQLEEGLRQRRPLTLISAPAGYGKTTLTVTWLQQHETQSVGPYFHVAWVSLDDDDDNPNRFFAYLAAAIQEAGVNWAPPNPHVWEFTDSPPVKTILTSLLNELNEFAEQASLILVLDDYHRIRSPVIHEALQFAVDHAPPNLHIILITREDPPLTLARWRARAQLTEIRAADLRFNSQEAAGFLAQTMALHLSADQIAALENRTEGWVAGLQLAALALKSTRPETGQSTEAFITSFGGSHHYIIDYLMDEVLRRQDDTVRDFLRYTSVLERLCPSLCDAVTGHADGRERLTQLEHANAFLIPLDNQREWYRYHHLMADSLQAGLDPQTRDIAHRRAAQWFEAHDLHAEAVRHAFAAGDSILAADMLERAIQEVSTWSRGDVSRLTGWLDMLPDSILATRPTLSLHASRALYLSGQMERADVLLHQAEQSLRDLDEGGLKAVAMVYRAAVSAMRGEDPATAAAMMRRLLDRPETMNIHTAARAVDTLGLACELVGDVAAAEQAYRQAADLAQAASVAYLAINARCECALVQITRGQLDSAEAMCRLALDSTGEEALPPTGLAWSILGEIARERNDPATAEKLIPLGIEIARKGGIVDDLRHALLFLVRLRQAQGDWTAARTAWTEVDALLGAYNIPRLTDLSAAYRARLDLAQGYITSAGHWARHYQELRTSRADAYLREFEDLTLIRVLIAENKADEAMRWLRPLTTSAREAGRHRTVIEARILQAGILAGSDVPAACVALGDALALAADAGFRQLFIDEGPSLSPLLAKTRHIAPAFVDSLALPQPQAKADNLSDDTPTDLLTRQSLSPRELDVLRLLAAGLSNQEIAATLVITVGTAKWHAHSIFEKLGARGRTQAVARAREQGLL